jgi:hypothetical protein
MGRRVPLRFRTVALFGLWLTFILGVATASATTLVMPDRDALMGTAVVVWGNTTQANGTASSLDCGDGSAPVAGPVVDRSYLSRTCTYAVAGLSLRRLRWAPRWRQRTSPCATRWL